MKRAFVLGLATAGLAACQDSPTTGPITPDAGPSLSEAPAARGGPPEYVPNEVIVKFRAGATEESRGEAMRNANAEVSERIHTGAMRRAGDGEGIVVARSGRPTPEAIAALRQSPAVEYAEPNWIYHHTATSSDPYYADGRLWGMKAGNGSNAEAAWAAGHTGSESVYVGIIDEGFQHTHPDLDANSWVNPYDPANGRDDDGNGYVDDIRGWDFDRNDNSTYDGGSSGGTDDHGTHVAGTIGAESNGSGVVGVNWNVTMISGKFLGRRGGTTANAIRAVDYFTDLKTRHGLNIVATNNSWGGGGFSQGLYDAIERANAKGILFIAAAGNGGSDQVGDDNDRTPHYPSSYNNANIIAVASLTSSGATSSFSNYGATSVDISAPGSGIWSSTAFSIYSSYNGTSMATPHVTGAVALYKSVKPAATAGQIKTAILSSAVPTSGLKVTSTGGRLDAFAALSK